MLPLDDLQTWLAAKGIAPVVANWMPDEPGQVVVVNASGGGAPMFDGAFEPTHVRVRSRAATDVEAEELALQVHALVTGSNGSFAAGATHVLYAEVTSGPPQFMGRDADERSIYLATYTFVAPSL